jgi:hypothetical protein
VNDTLKFMRLDKGELRVRRSNYGPLQWSLASPGPGTEAKFRRWNIVLIAILAFLVLGVFVVAEAPHTGSNASNAVNMSLKESESATSTQHTKSDKSAPLGIHRLGGPGDVRIDVKGGHRAS